MKRLFTYVALYLILSSCMAKAQQIEKIQRKENKLLVGDLSKLRGFNLKKIEIRKLSREYKKAQKLNIDIDYGISTSETNLISLSKLADTMAEIATEHNIRAMVTFETIPNSGASIKYQTIAERLRNEPPRTIDQLSNTAASIPVGYYYIWSERNGVPRSNQNVFYEIIENKTIQIPETK